MACKLEVQRSVCVSEQSDQSLLQMQSVNRKELKKKKENELRSVQKEARDDLCIYCIYMFCGLFYMLPFSGFYCLYSSI